MSKLIERDGKLFVEVGPNDSLGSIAFEHAGRSDRWRELLKCNKELDPNLPAIPGSTLELPESWADPGDRSAPQTIDDAQLPEPVGSASPSDEVAKTDLEARVRSALTRIASHFAEEVAGIKDKLGILEMQRDQDEKRLAEQGGKILTLEAQLKDLTGKANTAPPTPPPTPVPPEHAEGI